MGPLVAGIKLFCIARVDLFYLGLAAVGRGGIGATSNRGTQHSARGIHLPPVFEIRSAVSGVDQRRFVDSARCGRQV